MLRYLRLFGCFLRFSFSRAMEFRMDFYFRIVMDIVFYAVNILFFKVLFAHTGVLGGWTEEQTMVFVAGFLVLDGLSMTLFSNNLWMLGAMAARGDLDYYLVRPVSTIFFVSLRDFAANSFVNLLMAFGLFAWFIGRYRGPAAWWQIALFAALLLNGTYLRYCVRMLTIIPVFWLQSSEGVETLFFHLNRFIERPDAIFTGAVRIVLTTVLPFLLMASVPARVIFDPFDAGMLLWIAAVTLAFTAALAGLWKAGLRAYKPASS